MFEGDPLKFCVPWSSDLYQNLLSASKSHIPLTVKTPSKTYRDMVIRSYKVDQNTLPGTDSFITVEFQRILSIQYKVVMPMEADEPIRNEPLESKAINGDVIKSTCLDKILEMLQNNHFMSSSSSMDALKLLLELYNAVQ